VGVAFHARHLGRSVNNPQLDVGDVCTREYVALHVARGFSGTDGAALLSSAGRRRGKLAGGVRCDQGTDFTAIALDQQAYYKRAQLGFSRPRKSVDNCVCEAFNVSLGMGVSVATLGCLNRGGEGDLRSLAAGQQHLLAPRLQPPAAHRRPGIFDPRFIRARNSQRSFREFKGDKADGTLRASRLNSAA
jgi:hypothetical protein